MTDFRATPEQWKLLQHPITPPPALIDQWWKEAKQNAKYDEPIGPLVATQAAQWGADQQLEECCEWLRREYDWGLAAALRLDAELRPDPPTLKEQAMEALERMHQLPTLEDSFIIRRAIEQLPD